MQCQRKRRTQRHFKLAVRRQNLSVEGKDRFAGLDPHPVEGAVDEEGADREEDETD